MSVSASSCSGAGSWSTGGCSSSRCGGWPFTRLPDSRRHGRMSGSSERPRCSCSGGASRAAPTCRNTHSSDGPTASFSGSSSLSTSRPVTARFCAVGLWGVARHFQLSGRRLPCSFNCSGIRLLHQSLGLDLLRLHSNVVYLPSTF